jgi:hypothetical protein
MRCESVVYLRDRSTVQMVEAVLHDSTGDALRVYQMVSIRIKRRRKLFFEGEEKRDIAKVIVL